MFFRDAKAGYPAYIFDRKTVTIKVGKVTNTPMPHFDARMSGRMVVDLNVDVDGRVMPFVLDECSEVGYADDMVVSVGVEAILREVDRVENQSAEALKMVDYHKEAVEKCEALKREYSPDYRERTEANERMTTLEGKVDKLADAMNELLGKINQERSLR